MNKKGGLTDGVVFLVLAFIMAITIIILVFSATTVYNRLKTNKAVIDKVLTGTGHTADEIIDNSVGSVLNAYQSLKWITVMLLFGMSLSILLSSFLIRVNPVYFVPYIIVTIITIIISIPISNTYEVIYNNPMLSSTFIGFWGMTYIFLNLPIWIMTIMFLAGIIMFINMVRSGSYGGFE